MAAFTLYLAALAAAITGSYLYQRLGWAAVVVYALVALCALLAGIRRLGRDR